MQISTKNIAKKIVLTSLLMAVFAGRGLCATYDWVGATATAGVYNWNNIANWQVGGVAATVLPGSSDVVRIGVNAFTNNPTVTDAETCASIILGTYNNFTLTVNGTLTVVGNITQNNDPAFYQTTILAGTGTIACASFTLGDSTAPNAAAGLVNNVSCQVNQMTISGNLTLNAVGNATKDGVEYPFFSLDANKLTLGGQIVTTATGTPLVNGVGIPTFPGIGLFQMDSGTANTTLELTNANPVATPITSNFTVDFTNNGAGTGTVLYDAASGTQTVYSTGTAGLGINLYNYDALTFGGASTKTIVGGALTIGGNWTTAGAGNVDLSTNNPTITLVGNLVNSVNITQGSGNISVGGVFQNNAGTVTLGSGTLGVKGLTQVNAGTITGGSGAITVTGALQINGGVVNQGTGAITITGVFQNNTGTFTGSSANLTFNGGFSNASTFTAGTGMIYFGGTTQTLQDVSAAGTVFNNVTFNGSGTAIMSAGAGNFSVSPTGVLTVVSPANLVAGSATTGYLTLKSNATSSATVAALSGTSTITGVVNVQRYVTGGSMVYRSYRLMSSPVYAATVSSNNVYSLNYLQNSSYLTGTTGTAGGFDKTGNPTIYLFRENLVPGSGFTTGNFRGINNITASPGYQLDNETGTFNIPAGSGFLFFYRGDRSTSLTSKTVAPFAVPENTIFTASGTLNQGQVTVHDWYTPTSANLGYTVITGNNVLRGYNLAGNPYASSINWDLLNTTTTTSGIYGSGISNTMYVYDPVSRNYGAYLKGSGGLGTHNATNIIPSGQGFFVQATSATAQLIFNESAKVNTQVTGTNLLMSTSATTANSQYIHLQLAMDSVNTDDIIVRFADSIASKYDPAVDGAYMAGSGVVSLYSLSSDSVKLSINTQSLPQTTSKIPLVASETADGTYQIQAKSIVGVPQVYGIWLIDNYMKDTVDMRATPVYSFQVAHADTNSVSAGRFTLMIGQNPALAYQLLTFTAQQNTSLPQVDVAWTTKNEQNYTSFTVERSSDGATFSTVVGSLQSSGQGSYGLSDKYPLTGANYYRLKQVDVNNNTTYSTVVLVQYTPPSTTTQTSGPITVYPNPSASNVAVTVNASAPKSTSYQITFTSSVGLIVKNIKSTQPTWTGSVSDLLTGSYMIQVVNGKNHSLIGQAKFVKL